MEDEKMRKVIIENLVVWKSLLDGDALNTPLLEAEVRETLDTCYIVTITPDYDKKIAGKVVLEKLEHLERRWKQLYASASDAGLLLLKMQQIEQVTRSSLLKDYTKLTPPKVALRYYYFSKLDRPGDAKKTACEWLKVNIDEATEAYNDCVLNPIKELIFEHGDITRKLDAIRLVGAAKAEAEAGSSIIHLISGCNWDQLAMALTKDRILVTTIKNRGKLSSNEFKQINDGIAYFQNRYFKYLINGERFELTPYARTLTSKKFSAAEQYSDG